MSSNDKNLYPFSIEEKERGSETLVDLPIVSQSSEGNQDFQLAPQVQVQEDVGMRW